MTLLEALLAIALSLPPPWDMRETPRQYEARVTTIAQAIDAEVREATDWKWRPEALASALIVITYGESRFRRSVHAGEQMGDSGRSACLAQVQSSRLVPYQQWMALTGVDLTSTRNCVRAAAVVLTYSARRCVGKAPRLKREHMARAFALYGSGKNCRPYPSAERRAASWERVVRKLRAFPAPAYAARQ
jgi:hypothetical protein